MVMVTEVVGDPTNPRCNPTIHVVMNAGAVNHVDAISQGIQTTDAIPIAILSASESNIADQSAAASGDPEPAGDLKGFRKRWSSMRSSASVVSRDCMLDISPVQSPDPIDQSTPPFVQSPDEIEDPDSPSGPVMNRVASERQTHHEFLSNVKWAAFKMPWESPIANAVFNPDVVAPVDLRQDPSWSSVAVPAPSSSEAGKQVTSKTVSESPTFVKCIRSIKEATFKDMRESQMHAGLEKWNIIVRADSSESQVGLQIEESPESWLEILRACMGVKSPSTVVGRANSMLSFLRWHTVNLPAEPFLPLRESHAWEYVSFLSSSKAPASRAAAFIQSCRFAHFVLGIKGADRIFNSGRVVGLSNIQLSQKDVTKQARPLTVFEMQQLHNIASSSDRHLKDKVIASHLLLMAYCRCRHSDTLQIEDVEHDRSDRAGFIQLRTRYHKGSKTASKKSLLLPIVASSSGVGTPEWIQLWWENRVLAGLPVSGSLHGPLLPAPKEDEEGWTRRPVTSTELSDILKSFLSCPSDRFLTSHSLKVTTLSWCSKGGVCKEHRRLLGRHSSAVVDADSIYARDLMIAPVESLDRIIAAICEGRFYPDASRSQYWPLMESLTRTPVPPVPGRVNAIPMTPQMQPKHVTRLDFSQKDIAAARSRETGSGVHAEVGADADLLEAPIITGIREAAEVKTETDVSDWLAVAATDPIEVSSSSSGSDESLSDVESSSSDETDEAIVEASPAKIRRTGPEAPSLGETWWKHKQSKIVHSSHAVEPGSQIEPVSECGRRMTNRFARVDALDDWTSKCRVCFVGRRQP